MHKFSRNRDRCAFTLVELIVTLAAILICIALALPAIQSARESARRSQCGSNLRQFHFAYHDYAREEHKVRYLKPVNVCPSASENQGYFSNRMVKNNDTQGNTSTTIEFFEHAGGALNGRDDDPANWFSRQNIDASSVLPIVRRYVAYDRHYGSTANYLYFDGHIEIISGEVIESWAKQGYNFSKIGNGTPPF